MLTCSYKVIVNIMYLRGYMLTTSTPCMLTRWYSVNTLDLPLMRAHPIYGCTVFCVNENSRDYCARAIKSPQMCTAVRKKRGIAGEGFRAQRNRRDWGMRERVDEWRGMTAAARWVDENKVDGCAECSPHRAANDTASDSTRWPSPCECARLWGGRG